MDDNPDEEPQVPRLLYEDEHLLVMDKPAGVPVHPSPRWREGTVIQWLWARYEDKADRIQLAHRLDRETSGVLVATKDVQTNDRMHHAFRSHQVTKRYLALVQGTPPWSDHVVDAPIGKHPDSAVHIRMAVAEGGAASITRFHVVERLEGHAFLSIEPRTGRTHQIRVHLSHLGFPVVGDKIYGPDERLFIQWYEGRQNDALWARLGLSRHALHADALEMPHPWRDGRISVSAPLPLDMRRKINGLRHTR